MKNTYVHLFSTVLILVSANLTLAQDPSTRLFWPGVLDSSSPAGFTSAGDLLGPPPHDPVEFAGTDPDFHTASYTGFSDTPVDATDTSIDLLQKAGIDALPDVDFFAFEVNDGQTTFEGSTWTFEDGNSSISIVHNQGDSPSGAIVKDGVFTDDGEFVAYLLFDLTAFGINPNNPPFTVTVSGGGLGTPDIFALGVRGKRRVIDHKEIEDVTGDGIADTALLLQMADRKIVVRVINSAANTTFDPITFFSRDWEARSLEVRADRTGNGVQELSVVAEDIEDHKIREQTRDIVSPSTVVTRILPAPIN